MLAAHQTVQAGDLLLHIIGQFPDQAPAWNLLAVDLNNLGRDDAAQLVAERAAQLAPNSVEIQVTAGLSSAHAGRVAQAIEHFKAAMRLDSTNSRLPYLLGAAYEDLGQVGSARDTYQAALATFPSDADLKRAWAAVNGDLTGDHKPERITIQGTLVTVQDGSSGQELLHWTAPAGQSAPVEARLVDLNGNAPALLVKGANWATVFGLKDGKLSPLNTLQGMTIYRAIDRALVLTKQTGGQTTVTLWQLQDSSLNTISSHEQDAPHAPNNLIELFAAAAPVSPTAFQDREVYQDLWKRFGDPTGILLPLPDGTYRYEVSVNGKLRATVSADVSTTGALQIVKLQWQ